MKSLKKLAVIAALSSAMNAGAKEVNYSVDYTPDVLNGIENFEINGLELVNGQLMVKSTGKNDNDAYMFVGTNTQHFAENAFAKKGMDNVTMMARDGKDLYMMVDGNETNVFHTVVNEKPTLNGMTNPVDVLTKDDAKAAKIIEAYENGSKLVIFDGDDRYEIKSDGVYKNGSDSASFMGGLGSEDIQEGTIEGLALIKSQDGKKQGCILATDKTDGKKKVFTSFFGKKEADEISANSDNSVLFVRKGQDVYTYNPVQGGWQQVKNNSEKAVQLPEGTKASVKVGNMIYYATAKKLGYKTY